MAMSFESRRKGLFLSLAFGLMLPGVPVAAKEAAAPAEPATKQATTATSPAPTPAPTATAPAAQDTTTQTNAAAPAEMAKEPKADKNHGSSGAVEHKRYEDEGYYSKHKPKKEEFSDIQKRHQDEGYYSNIKPYAPPPPEPTPIAPPTAPPVEALPPPLVVPPVKPDESGRKFDDDTGNTGSILATRHAKQAKNLLESGQYEQAKRHFKDSLNAVPNQPDLLPGYWECCTKTNDWSEAMRALDKLFELKPAMKADYAWAYGEALYQLRRFDKAVPALKDALKYGKKLDAIHGYLLKIAQQQHDNAAVISEYTAMLKLKPTDYKTQLDFANTLELQGKHEDALTHYRAASNLQPSDGPLAARVAYMLMYYNKDYKSAINYYNKALMADPANAGRYQDSIKYCQFQMQPQKQKQQN